MARKDSVFHYYQKLIALRRQYDIIVYGDYELLLPDSQTLLVVCNFTEREVGYDVPDGLAKKEGKVLISNYERTEIPEVLTLAPFECIVVLYGQP